MAKYGAKETNPLVGDHPKREARVALNDPRLDRITRLRLISDPGLPWWDVSYCYGLLKDGTWADVVLPECDLRRGPGAPSLSSQLVAIAKSQGVYARGIGLLDSVSTLY
jgi:hypothetical protein